jgi:C-terminal processing protease CtpA/Prc
VFDRGFNLGATARAHDRVQELEPGGPAERAGLKEGDHILIDEPFTRDSRVTLTYRVVEPDGRRRTVSYKPEGATQVRFQKIELTPLAQQDPARCRGEMARP